MFEFKNIVDQTAGFNKKALAFLPNEDVRSGLSDVIDAQAVLTKHVYDVTVDIANMMTEFAKNLVKTAK